MAKILIQIPVEIRGNRERVLQLVHVYVNADHVERALESGSLKLERQTVVLGLSTDRDPARGAA